MVSKRFVSYDDVNTMLATLFREMSRANYKPDVVVGLVRGGLIPAVHISHYYDVPLVAFKYSLRDHAGVDSGGKLTELLDAGKKILIVDDICDEGHTLAEIMNYFPESRKVAAQLQIKTAVLQHNLGSRLFVPDFAAEEINKVEKPEWIVYPWEY